MRPILARITDTDGSAPQHFGPDAVSHSHAALTVPRHADESLLAYSVLRTLTKNGHAQELPTEQPGNRLPRTRYRITPSGRRYYRHLLAEALALPTPPIAVVDVGQRSTRDENEITACPGSRDRGGAVSRSRASTCSRITQEPLIVPALVITEVTFLIGTRLGADAEVRFLGELAAGNLIAEPVHASDWLRIAELVAQYRNLPLNTANASIITAAERLDIPAIATVDRRRLTVARSTLGDLKLLP